MARGEVDLVVVGADRIAANGDVANKVGTYPLAVLARHHGIPFVVAAPRSTIDLATPDGAAIAVEERAADRGDRRRRACGSRRRGTSAANPAFDVTPAGLVHAIVTERGSRDAPEPRRSSRAAGEERDGPRVILTLRLAARRSDSSGPSSLDRSLSGALRAPESPPAPLPPFGWDPPSRRTRFPVRPGGCPSRS